MSSVLELAQQAICEGDDVTLGDRIRVRRHELGWSQPVAAGKCGISTTHFHDIEGGKASNPTVGTLYAISQGLGLPLTELVRLALDAELSRELLAEQVADLLYALPDQDQSEILSVLEAMTAARKKRLGL